MSSFIGIGVSLISLAYYSGGIWIKEWQTDFGWSRGEIGIGQGIASLVIVLGAPFAGILIDRFGLKKTVPTSLLLYGFCFLLFSKMNGSLWMYYTLSVLIALVALPSTPLGFTRAINAWFDKNKGLALGISLCSTGLGGFFIPKYLTPYVAEQGWREGQFLLFVVVMIAIPFVWMLLRDAPPKNESNNNETEQDGTAESEKVPGLTLKEALKTATFWKVGMIFLLVSVAILGLIPSFIPLLQDAGMTPAEAGGYAGILGLSVVSGRIITGFLIDRIFAPRVVIVLFSLVASGCLALGLGGIDYTLWAAIALGLAVGAEVDLIGYFAARYFGLKNYGSVYGALYSIFTAGAIISPGIAGFIWDKTGNYDLALIIGAVLIMLAVVVAFFLPKFPHLDQK